MTLICKRASGELKTTATWMREFVTNHPEYKQDSVVSDAIAHDLVMEFRAIGEVRRSVQPLSATAKAGAPVELSLVLPMSEGSTAKRMVVLFRKLSAVWCSSADLCVDQWHPRETLTGQCLLYFEIVIPRGVACFIHVLCVQQMVSRLCVNARSRGRCSCRRRIARSRSP